MTVLSSVEIDYGGYTGWTILYYIGDRYVGSSPERSSGNFNYIVISLCLGAFVFMIGSILSIYHISANFILKKNGSLFSHGSRRRKIIFFIAILSGWLGVDRFLMGRFLYGCVKLFFGFLVVGNIILTDSLLDEPLLFLSLYFLLCAVAFIMWTVDIVLIHSGMAKSRKKGVKDYLR